MASVDQLLQPDKDPVATWAHAEASIIAGRR